MCYRYEVICSCNHEQLSSLMRCGNIHCEGVSLLKSEQSGICATCWYAGQLQEYLIAYGMSLPLLEYDGVFRGIATDVLQHASDRGESSFQASQFPASFDSSRSLRPSFGSYSPIRGQTQDRPVYLPQQVQEAQRTIEAWQAYGGEQAYRTRQANQSIANSYAESQIHVPAGIPVNIKNGVTLYRYSQSNRRSEPNNNMNRGYNPRYWVENEEGPPEQVYQETSRNFTDRRPAPAREEGQPLSQYLYAYGTPTIHSNPDHGSSKRIPLPEQDTQGAAHTYSDRGYVARDASPNPRLDTGRYVQVDENRAHIETRPSASPDYYAIPTPSERARACTRLAPSPESSGQLPVPESTISENRNGVIHYTPREDIERRDRSNDVTSGAGFNPPYGQSENPEQTHNKSTQTAGDSSSSNQAEPPTSDRNAASPEIAEPTFTFYGNNSKITQSEGDSNPSNQAAPATLDRNTASPEISEPTFTFYGNNNSPATATTDPAQRSPEITNTNPGENSSSLKPAETTATSAKEAESESSARKVEDPIAANGHSEDLIALEEAAKSPPSSPSMLDE